MGARHSVEVKFSRQTVALSTTHCRGKPGKRRRLSLQKFGAPFARRGAETRAKRLVEIRQVVESAVVGNLRNAARALLRAAKRMAGRIEPGVEQPTAKGLLKFLETQMQGSRGDAELCCHEIRGQRRVMQVSTAEVEQRLELQFRLHTAERGVDMVEQTDQIAEIFGQQRQFALGQVVGGQLQQMPPGKVDIDRI